MNVEWQEEKCGKGVFCRGDTNPGGHAVLAIHEGAVHALPSHAGPLMSGRGMCPDGDVMAENQ